MPKRIPIDHLFAKLGKERAERLLADLYAGPDPTQIRCTPETARAALVALSDPYLSPRSWVSCVPSLRRWVAERPLEATLYVRFVEQLANPEGGGAPDQTVPAQAEAGSVNGRRTRRKITDPDSLEKRRAALVKARAARSLKLAQAALQT